MARAKRSGELACRVVGGSVAGVSVVLLDGRAVLDPDYSEDVAAEVDMNVSMTGRGRFVEVQGTGEGAPFDEASLQAMLALARQGIRRLLRSQRAAVRAGLSAGRGEAHA